MGNCLMMIGKYLLLVLAIIEIIEIVKLPKQIADTTYSKPTAIKTNSLKSGAFVNMPNNCNTGDLFVAVDQQQPLQVCMQGSYHPFVSIGPSGAVTMNQGSVDIVTSVVPRLMATNQFTGYNSFVAFKLIPQSTNLDCLAANQGLFWVDNSDTNVTRVKVCGTVNSNPKWISLAGY